MKNYKQIKELEDKKSNIKKRIEGVVTKITELEHEKVSLMILHRDVMMDLARESLEQAFTPQLKSLLEKEMKESSVVEN